MDTDRQLAFASFVIYQDIESPEFWTNYFGVLPDVSGKRGDSKAAPLGRGRASKWRIGIWGVRTKHVIRSDSLEPHFRYLIDRLGLPRKDLPDLILKTHATVRFFCYWDNERGDRIPDIPDDIAEICKSQGIEIDIDEHR